MTATASGAPETPGFTPREVTRAKGTYLGISTPEEFFRTNAPLQAMARDLGGRFGRCAGFVDPEDFQQFAAEQILRCRIRWTPENGIPFGAYAWKSCQLWLTGQMHRESVPVTGFSTRAEVESIRYSGLDTPIGAGQDGGTTTLGEILGLADTAYSGDRTVMAEDAMIAQEIRRNFLEFLEGLSPEVVDAILAVLHGEVLEEIVGGYTPEGLCREAGRFREYMKAKGRPTEG